jgi:hypothetical protein
MVRNVRRGKPFWNGKIHQFVYIRTPSGREEEVLFIYILRRDTLEDDVVRPLCRWDKSFEAMGISRGAVKILKNDVLADCRRHASSTKKKREEREELKELRAIVKAKKKKTARTPKEQLALL